MSKPSLSLRPLLPTTVDANRFLGAPYIECKNPWAKPILMFMYTVYCTSTMSFTFNNLVISSCKYHGLPMVLGLLRSDLASLKRLQAFRYKKLAKVPKVPKVPTLNLGLSQTLTVSDLSGFQTAQASLPTFGGLYQGRTGLPKNSLCLHLLSPNAWRD